MRSLRFVFEPVSDLPGVTRLEAESPRGRIHLVRAAADGRIELNRTLQRSSASLSALPRLRVRLSLRRPVWPHRRNRAGNIGPPGSQAAKAAIELRLYATTAPSPQALKLAFTLLRLYQRSGLQRLHPPVVAGEAAAIWMPCYRQSHQRFFSRHANILPAIGPRRARRHAQWLRHAAAVQRRERSHRTGAATQRLRCRISPKANLLRRARTFTTANKRRLNRWRGVISTRFLDADVDAIVVNAAGCGAAMKEYDFLLRDDPVYAEKAKRFTPYVKDAGEFLAGLGLVGRSPR